MAKGRMAEKAAKRKAELDAANDLGTYQRKVVQLTAENRELKERLAAQERAAKQAERRLRAERDEGVAPQVEALTLQLRAALAARDEAQRAVKRVQEMKGRLADRVYDHLIRDHKLGAEAAMEMMLSWGGQGDKPSMVVRNRGVRDISTDPATIERQRRIDASRGIAHLPSAGTARAEAIRDADDVARELHP